MKPNEGKEEGANIGLLSAERAEWAAPPAAEAKNDEKSSARPSCWDAEGWAEAEDGVEADVDDCDG